MSSSSLPNGYETEIGEGGAYLSGASANASDCARAVFETRAFVVLGRAQLNLDNEGEWPLSGPLQR